MTGVVGASARTPAPPPGLGALFAPRGIAVVGRVAVGRPSWAGGRHGPLASPGSVGPWRFGQRPRSGAVPVSVAEAVLRHGPIDLAVLCVPAAVATAALLEAASAGALAALVCAGGFAEAGDAGAAHQRDLSAAAHDAGVALLGPNTSGFVVPASGLTASFVPGAALLDPGPVAVVAASGGVNHALAFQLAAAGSGVSLAVGIGNGAGVTAVEVLHHLGADDATTCVALHVEAVPDGPALVEAIAAVAARKPVVALVVGRNDVAEFARSHTGALATSWRTTRAALSAAGAVIVDDERELVDAAIALSFRRLPATQHTGVGVVTAQAGPGLLHVDGLRGAGVEVPELTGDTTGALAGLLPPMTYQRNPVDTGRPGETFGAVLRTVAADAAVSLTSVYALTEPDTLDLPAAIAAAAPGPFVVGLDGPEADVREQRDRLRAYGVAAVVGPGALTNAVRALVADARAQAEAEVRPGPVGAAVVLESPPDENEAKDLLGALGVPTPSRRVCIDRDEARRALAELAGPVAVKILDARSPTRQSSGGCTSASVPRATSTGRWTRSPRSAPPGSLSRPWPAAGST